MAVVRMSKMHLTGLAADRERILDALQRTQCAELREEPADEGSAAAEPEEIGRIRSARAEIGRAIEFLAEEWELGKKWFPDLAENRKPSDAILITNDEFLGENKGDSEQKELVSETERLSGRVSELRAETARIQRTEAQLAPYRGLTGKFSEFRDTRETRCFLGLLDEAALPALQAWASGEQLAELTILPGGKQRAVVVVCHRSAGDACARLLEENAFSVCRFDEDRTPAELTADLDRQRAAAEEERREICRRACDLLPELRRLKIRYDYETYRLEKEEAFWGSFRTRETFTVRGYVPEPEIGRIREAIAGVTDAAEVNFEEPAEDETPPTLLANRGPARAAEFVTDMYSVPDYREYDPNGFVFFFFMVFFGLIMADIGYGLLLAVGGLVLMRRQRAETGMKKLARILAYGGLFTVLFGALFGSCFGFSLYKLLPDPSSGNRTDVLTVLLGCLALGLLQITVGYALKAVNAIRKRQYADAVFDALPWILFDVGLFLAVFRFLTDYFGIPVGAEVSAFFGAAALPGAILAGVGLLTAMLTAGRREKFLGKFTKGFGALYGVIGLLSDVLSYARIFGLMLSGMIIAQQFNGIGLDLIAGGPVGWIFGPLVMLIGHAFNLAMGVLGAYIHDCRLQYIEFFSKFYTGEGEAFAPLGSRFEYIHFIG